TSVPPSWRTYVRSVILTSAVAAEANVAAAPNMTTASSMKRFMLSPFVASTPPVSPRRPEGAKHPSAYAGELEAVSLFAPGVRVVVVPVALPETGLVHRAELDRAQPFRALPEGLRSEE